MLCRMITALLPIIGASLYAQTIPNLVESIAAHPPQVQLAQGQAMGEEVSFPSGSLTLKGFIYKPAGAGPFPALIWNHGSEKLPGWQPELAAFYNIKGFVFFIPHRHGQGRSPGEYIVDLTNASQWKETVRLHEIYNEDVRSAVRWLTSQPFVDSKRVIMSGVSYGGIQTLLSAEAGLGIRGFIPFAPAAMSWANLELRKRLLVAVKNAKAPVFLLQAANDYSTGPSETLGPAITKKGGLNRAKLYPAFGTTPQQGHGAFAMWDIGTRLWGRT